MRSTIISIVIAAAVSAAAPVLGHPGHFREKDVSVEIITDSGSAFHGIQYQDFRRDGVRIIKRYLEARKGENYSIVIRNGSPERIGVVIAVDGRNIISSAFRAFDGWREAKS